ncbi:hypothetical protein RA2_04059 [Roseovarius sp. A-2]|uniref:hypothetical protein n=1 Tax=Roseovarius sp. A-2 TaxID=1570360 RepID=UPI0009B5195C|nr:hypothetical protein [Roseovarius sp. A-2]GAW36984.1 hypothetical protein RA2_04059 [Roseovarius sp. A-2]
MTRENLIRYISAFAEDADLPASDVLSMLRTFIAAADARVTTKASNDELMNVVREIGFQTRKSGASYIPLVAALRHFPSISESDFAA